MILRKLTILLCAVCAGCSDSRQESIAPLYDTAPVETRSIEITVDAAGVIEPEILVEVKSKASGEVLAIHAETGDVVEAGTLLVEIDQRTPRNQLDEAEAALVAAQAWRGIAQTQMERAETLYGSGTLTQTDFEQSQLEFANAQADVIGKQVALENARIAMDDTEVRAPITGTIISRSVEPGNVISSPTRDVSGGSVLLRMANLTSVQVRTLVDETDIGKVHPGMRTRVIVAAYPNQPFEGTVLKIEPQAIVDQNVTMFAVLIRLENLSGLLLPGMNAEVHIEIANKESVAVVPTMALRVNGDIPAAAAMLGMPEASLRARLGAIGAPVERASDRPDSVRSLIEQHRGAAELSGEDAALLARLREQRAAAGGVPGSLHMTVSAELAGAGRYEFGGSYWVVALEDGAPVPTAIETGLTDLEYSEVIAGLGPGDEVLLLPSSSLYEQQAMLQRAITERFGSSSPFQRTAGGGPRFR
jgi:HlyD family secretion protein